MKHILLFFYQWFIFAPIFVLVTIVTALSVTIGCAVGNRSFWAYVPPRYWSKITCRLALCRIKVKGVENISAEQSYVFTPNHQSYFDIFLIYGYLPKNIKWVQKQELRKIPLVGKASEIAGHVFVDQSSLKSRKESIAKAEKQLREEPGASMVIFPEGARSYTGKLGKFKRGAFLIAEQLSLPVVPITINGICEVLRRGTWNLNPGTMELIIHQPLSVEDKTDEEIVRIASQTQTIVESALWDKYKNQE
ncbi:MAG: 1-acyl-sn-glycerol-3-phosphate acyltransferase [Bacteroidales bacterium 45-6]|nr:MAG: 1-acyl-sn-glycerol-3-phosphate acyltransferase [Bacteroidales bacterium 45-6]